MKKRKWSLVYDSNAIPIGRVMRINGWVRATIMRENDSDISYASFVELDDGLAIHSTSRAMTFGKLRDSVAWCNEQTKGWMDL